MESLEFAKTYTPGPRDSICKLYNRYVALDRVLMVIEVLSS